MRKEDFELFTARGGRYTPTVSIRKNGQIGLSQGTVLKFKLKQYPFARLYFSQTHNAVGIEPLKEAINNGIYKLNVRQSGADISGKAFCEYYGIDTSKSRSFPAKWDDALKMIIIDLKKGGS